MGSKDDKFSSQYNKASKFRITKSHEIQREIPSPKNNTEENI
jgi:hypothetical protein